MKKDKTNAMRALDKAGIAYETYYYDLGKEPFSGEAVSELLGLSESECFKTLACRHERELFLLVIPVDRNLDLKKASAFLRVKNLEMVKVRELKQTVGYERGSDSPLGVTVRHRTAFDVSALNFEHIEISGGKLGIGLKVGGKALIECLDAEVGDLCQ